ncbi:MAG: ferritin-like domain-containing protein [Oligoflexia bacterium]|nr:ferritin-like domain-containing protein [Oligoflexia bacterium]
MQFLERLKVNLMTRFAWKKPGPRLAETLVKFEATEEDSSWHLLQGLKQEKDCQKKAKLFQQVLEEFRHAEEFQFLYKEIFAKKLKSLKEERQELFRKTEVWKLYAFCRIGEESAAKRFAHIIEADCEPRMKRVLKRIVADEEGHIEEADVLLDVLPIHEVTAELRRIRLKRFKESWMRMGRHLTGIIGKSLLLGFYFGIGWAFSKTANARFISNRKNLKKEGRELVYESPRIVF